LILLNVAKDNNNIDNPGMATTATPTNNSNEFVTGVTLTKAKNIIQPTSKSRKMPRKYRRIGCRRKIEKKKAKK
jgi:hypothetical protein